MVQPKEHGRRHVLRASLAKPHIQSSDRVLDRNGTDALIGMRMNSTYTPVDLDYDTSENNRHWPILTTMDLEGEWDCALALALLEHIMSTGLP